jgi:glycosyltransferase involved in cell wall biosynthesis
VHANSAHFARMILNKFNNPNLIVTYHGYPMPELESTLKMKEFYLREAIYLKDLYEKGYPVITISEYCRRKLKERYEIEVTDVIYHGCDRAFFTPQKKDYTSKKTVKILYNSHLRPYKEPLLLLKAMDILKNKFKLNFALLIRGKGQLESELKRFAKEKNLMPNITFIPFVDFKDLPKIYKIADIFVHTCRVEGFGLVILEAMASGLPVVVPDEGGAKEVAGCAGITFKAGDPENLANVLANLITNTNTLTKFSELSIKRSYDFSWEETAKKYMAHYQQLLNKNFYPNTQALELV